MTHAGPEDPLVATIHNMTKKLGRVLPHTSVIFHAYASADTPWVARTLSHYTSVKRGKVSSNSSTHEATKFAGPHKSHMHQYIIKCLFIRTQPTWALIDTGGGYHLGASNIRSDHSPSFPSSILHFRLIAASGLQLCELFDHLAKPHRTSIDRKGPITSGFEPLVFYR